MSTTLRVFYWMLRRDLHRYRQNAVRYLVDFGLIYPALFALSFGLLLPTISLGGYNPYISTLFICGSTVWIFWPITWNINHAMLYDLKFDQFTQYQMSIIHPRLVLLERLLFCTLVAFINTLPFLLVSKLILGDIFLTAHANWPQLITMILVASLTSAATTLCAVCYLEDVRAANFVIRIFVPMNNLAGLFTPWHIMNKLSPTLGTLLRINPMLYILEGIRSTLLGGTEFIPFATCVPMLLGWTVIFMLLSFYFFKRKMDHL